VLGKKDMIKYMKMAPQPSKEDEGKIMMPRIQYGWDQNHTT
jgi:hypothetical protein